MVRDVAMFPGLLPIFLHSCEINSGSDTTTLSLRVVPFKLPTMHTKTLHSYVHLAYSFTLNQQGTQYYSLHSLPSFHICHVLNQ